MLGQVTPIHAAGSAAALAAFIPGDTGSNSSDSNVRLGGKVQESNCSFVIPLKRLFFINRSSNHITSLVRQKVGILKFKDAVIYITSTGVLNFNIISKNDSNKNKDTISVFKN